MKASRWMAIPLAITVVALGLVPVVAADVSFDEFFNEISSLDKQARTAVIRGLSNDERRSLHEQFRALPDAERAAAAEILLPRLSANHAAPKAGRAVATVQYDSGVAHPYRSNSSDVVGNAFNTGFADPHSLTTVTVQINGTFFGPSIPIFGAPVGATAPLLTSVTGPWNLHVPVAFPIPNAATPAPITGHSGTFLAGIAQSGTLTVPDSTYTGVDVDINSAGFGFHGMSINAAGNGFNASPSVCLAGTVVTTGTGTTFSCTGGYGPFNAIVRMTGNNLPVELMTFSAE